MQSKRKLFLDYLAQTSDSPLALEISKSEGIYLYSTEGKKYIDLISGISVSNLGHNNERIKNAVKKQLDNFTYLMVYGEYVLSPQVELAEKLSEILPKNLNNTYFVNSGSEAVEASIKLAKRFTGRFKVASFKNSYHGSTHGALSLMGNEFFKKSFRPLLPGVRFLEFNNADSLKLLDDTFACVIVEPVQAEAGVIIPQNDFLNMLKRKCEENNILLIFDEIQTGIGRSGELFTFQKFNVVPDVLLLAKAFGGGFPLGAVVSSKEILNSFTHNPPLGHITTFGGHPISCVAALENLKQIIDDKIVDDVEAKGQLFKKLLVHKNILSVNQIGLLISVELNSNNEVQKAIKYCINKGLITDWFLFADNKLRIAPPLIITKEQIEESCKIILSALS